MRFVLPFVAFFLISFVSFSQLENFDLSKYKLPEIKRHLMDFGFNSDGSTRNTFYIYENGIDTFKDRSKNFSWTSNLNYSIFSSSTQFQKTLNTNLYSNVDFTDSESNYSRDYIQLDYQNRFNFSYDWKHFINNKMWFINLVPSIYSSLSNSNSLLNSDDGKSYSYTNQSSVGVGFGKGRIEQVQDFRQAILIFRELEKKGSLKRNPTEKEVVELATLISKLKNQRVFDSRKRKQADLTEINSYLNKNELITKTDILYFIGLEDMWVFGGLQTRESGNQIKLIFTPEFNYNISGIQKEDPNYETGSWAVNTDFIFISKIPLSNQFQSNFEIGMYNKVSDHYKVSNESEPYKSFVTDLMGTYSLGFYPNTRTYLNITSIAGIGHSSFEKIFENGYFNSWLSFSSNGYYYISERLRIGYQIYFDKWMNYIFDEQRQNEKFSRFNYTLNFNYAIF